MIPFTLEDFVTESNRIEGMGKPTKREMQAHVDLLAAPRVAVEGLERFVWEVTEGQAKLRTQPGMNVMVGGHAAPRGGPLVETMLQEILDTSAHPFEVHVAYELLHPFMDGNGRSGRVLWLHRMGGIEMAPLGFLHTFYYQTLNWERER